MSNMKSVKTHNQNGFALLLAMIVSSVVLAIGVSILNISINQINLSATARESEFAFQAAHAGVDCMWYWRYKRASVYKASDAAASPQPSDIQCFGHTPRTGPTEFGETKTNVTGGYVRFFHQMFEWGNDNDPVYPKRCTVSDLYVMNAVTANIVDYDFSSVNIGVGDNGKKDCDLGNVCTVIISRGYNRDCDEINSSIFSIQREIVVEF